MNANDSGRERQADGLAALLPVPAERDLPAGRQRILKEHLMTEVRATQPDRRAAPSWRPHRKIFFAAGASMLAARAVMGTAAPRAATARRARCRSKGGTEPRDHLSTRGGPASDVRSRGQPTECAIIR